MWKDAKDAKDDEAEEGKNWMLEQTVKITRKKRVAKTKKD